MASIGRAPDDREASGLPVDGPDERWQLRRLGTVVYVPAAVYSVGVGAVLPALAISADERGASLSIAGLIAGLPVVGRLFGDPPSGWIIARIGERIGMVAAGVITLLASLVVIFVPHLLVLAVAAFTMGMASSMCFLARHSLLTTNVPSAYRARAMSLLAGMSRIGMTVGPLSTVAFIDRHGAVVAYWVQAATCMTLIVVVLVVPEPQQMGTANATDIDGGLNPRALRDNVGVLLRLGVGVGILMMLRASRQIIIPLCGIAVGVSAADIALAVGVAGMFEIALFYPAGYLMDRLGRRWIACSVTVGLAAGHVVLIWVDGTVSFYVVTVLLGLANSLGGGIMMTLGSDLAPAVRTSEFLGVWRVFADGGGALAPLVISGGTLVTTLGASAAGLGGTGLVGAWMLWRWIPRYVEPPVRRLSP